ncbi:helix-turn-helix domain-containing protein [Bradyrhizobium sp. IC3123]|uniref:helix-turn-helix domain-containing protein n=1 Tax=Bradyrhizobium sp. IC3123 TaxID=2793803 RepID=UPI001CD1A92D|nr:helix-turn-helix domain-containing protein [Bradyrhizobium sp. IC3123]MCA1393770.1 helix-turn-helix domain-containing protein [Bradyrhizobium sp. IC3123]
MSWQATAWALRQKVEPPARKLLLLVLATYADKHGICWPSQETLAEDTGMSLDTIQRHTKKLKNEEFLTIARPPKRRGQWQTFVYQLSMSAREGMPHNLGARNEARPLHADISAPRSSRAAASPKFAHAQGVERRGTGGSVIEAADRLVERLRSFDAGPGGALIDHQAAFDRSSASVCGTARPHLERLPGRTAMRLKPSIEPSKEPSALPTTNDAQARLQAFRANQEPTEVIQNRIARRLGPEGWLVLGELSNSERERLTALERRHELDDETLNHVVLCARSSSPR